MKLTFPLVLASVLCLSACGNKGPLVMPQQPVPVDEAVPAAQPAPPATPEVTPDAPQTSETPPADATSAPADPK